MAKQIIACHGFFCPLYEKCKKRKNYEKLQELKQNNERGALQYKTIYPGYKEESNNCKNFEI